MNKTQINPRVEKIVNRIRIIDNVGRRIVRDEINALFDIEQELRYSLAKKLTFNYKDNKPIFISDI